MCACVQVCVCTHEVSWIDKSHDISNLIHNIINLIQSTKLVVKIIIVKLVVKRLYDTSNVIHNIIDLIQLSLFQSNL
jgi:methyl-accepting chemotaxis protein